MNAGDAAAFNNLYTADGISAQNHAQSVTGRDAIVASQKAAFDQFTFKVALKADETQTTGEVGFDRGTFTMTLTPKAGGEPMTQQGRYMVLLRKEADGKWRVSRDIDNSAEPMPMPAPPTPPAEVKK
jgi:uncharacterized protein (TIGR02246 family)